MITSKTLDIVSRVRAFDEKALVEALQKPKAIRLLENGKSDFSIAVAKSEDRIVAEAALFLRKTLNRIAGGPAFSFQPQAPDKPKMILIETLAASYRIKDDGYAIRTKDGNIHITGICGQGTANGIYGFLEDFLGCMYVRPDYDYLPRSATIYLDEIDTVSNPDFLWRCQYQYEVFATDWYKKLRSNGSNDRAWGSSCHTVFRYVDPKIYFREHPEYFSLRWGKRTPEQLCLSNPDIWPIISRRAGEMMAEKPRALYWDFSINDNLHYCQCKNCRKLYRKYGKSGSILLILNRLAKEHPDKIISTLAYTYNEKPPKNLKMEPNINIMLAPIKSGQKYSYAFSGSRKARRTHRLIVSWGRLVQNLYVWDYIVNFKHTLLPYPNFDVQRDNLRFYKQNNVKLVFHQGMRDAGCELASLRSYIMTRQLWDIDCDIDALMAKYLCVTYKKAAVYVAKYLEAQNRLMRKKAADLDLYDDPRRHRFDYLSAGAIRLYSHLLDRAFEAEKNDPEILWRLEELKINVLYAKFNETSADSEGKRAAFREFERLVEKHGIDRYNEWNRPTLEELYKNGFKNYRH